MNLKFALLLSGHLRGDDNVDYINNIFKRFNLDYINEHTNSQYTNIIVDTYLLTVSEINRKSIIDNYIKTVYPLNYKKHTVEDFKNWINTFKSKIDFKKLIILDSIDFQNKLDELYNPFKYKIESNLLRNMIYCMQCSFGSQFYKRELLLDMIDEEYDVLLFTRPDIIFKNSIGEIEEYKIKNINDIIVKSLNNKKTVYFPFIDPYNSDIISGDAYTFGSFNVIKEMYKNLNINNLILIEEYDKILKNKNVLIDKIIHNFVGLHYPEIKQLANCKINNIKMACHYIEYILLYNGVPFDINLNNLTYDTIYSHPCNSNL